jgi:hypothetical protein
MIRTISILLFLFLTPQKGYCHSENYKAELEYRKSLRIQRRIFVANMRLSRLERRKEYQYGNFGVLYRANY